ncbi:MAG: phage integrase N-terminal SAM-like domain-containing protein [Candidatus Marinimicrobia bacterium]|nr:phage integrase N-terminal SAM-like domain-containing protein [Candidatus Neomarinimicrobiota bacterium]
MRKAELLKTAKQKLAIRNYSKRTIQSYLSAINHFANWLIQEKVTTVNDRIVEKYLFELKENKKRSISAMKQSIAAIKFVFSEVLA